MVAAFAAVLVVHGLIHLLGVVKAFGLAELPQLTQPVTVAAGIAWLVAAILFLAAAAALFMWPRGWWMLGAAALVLSTLLVASAWTDAKAGAIANALILAGVAYGFLSQGPYSLRAAYDRDVAAALARTAPAEIVRDVDVAHLPAPVQRYLRVAGVVGQPRVRSLRARMHGRIRGSSHDRWILLAIDQIDVFDPPARFFYMRGSMFAIPVLGYHRYVGTDATMRVKAAALVPVAEAAGEHMTQSETVTLFNDMCTLAPATLIDPRIVWTAIDDRSARASFSNAGYTIQAELRFDDAGDLVDFVSDDRYQLSSDGRSAARVRWSTPMTAHRSFGAVRLGSQGVGMWHEASGAFSYIELTIDDVAYNVETPG